MNLFSISEASKEIGDKILYQDISFGFDETEKAAIIGINGCGKSTLLKIIAGLNTFDKGKFAKNNKLICGYLDQNIDFDENQTIYDFIFSSDNRRIKILKDYLSLQIKISDPANETIHSDLKKIEALEEKMETLDVWRLESEAREILYHLNIYDMKIKMSELSGGMVKKTALARLLIEDNNLLLLDEPTNHLDIASIAWLEEYLCKTKKALLIITHDRYFLDNVVNYIIEIDNCSITKYKGNYSSFLEKKEEIAAIEQRTIAKRQNILLKELEWLRRMPKARGTKQKARIQQIDKSQIQTQSLTENAKRKNKISALYSREERLGKKILEIINISKTFGDDLIFSSFSYEFKKKERIGIIGDNGAGKTTFLKILMQVLKSDTGKINYGINTKIGYLSQTSEKVDENLSLIQAVKEIANFIEYENGKKITAGQLLERFLFESGRQGQKVGKLSGGERRRLDIMRILMQNPNFLILDEPTNDLDLQTMTILENFLLDFPGCLIVVSHDRYFLDKLTDMLFIFEKGKNIRVIPGLCSDYIFTEKKSAPQKTKEIKPEKIKKKTKLSYHDQKRKDLIEKEIPDLEKEIELLREKL
ncbi:MAG: ATP-binding cassette domain-containing protein, partial [Spirochaetia bacterium]|nr:ATP-binding cassette domain-containing protein [Spirochaetia bacterium]